MFRHDCPLAAKPASPPLRLLTKQTWGDSLRIDIFDSAVSLGCCAAEFGNPGGIYELPGI
jgi:hypothetical protein